MTDDRRTQTCDDESARDLSRRDFVALSVAAGLATARTPPRRRCRSPRRPLRSRHQTARPRRCSLTRRPEHIPACSRGRTRLACVPRYAASAPASPPRVTRCWSRTRSSIGQGHRQRAAVRGLLRLWQSERHGQAEAGHGIDPGLWSGRTRRGGLLAFFDAQSQVNKARKVGTQGYCMGGALVVRTAASLPIVSAPGHRSTVVNSSPTHPTALIVWRRRSKRGCISGSQPTTTAVSRMRRTS